MKTKKLFLFLAIFLLAIAMVQAECLDEDYDGYGDGCTNGVDCDDNNPTVYAGAVEICDGIDNDCDGIEDNPGCIPVELYCFIEGATEICGSDVGECATGTRTCVNHVWSECSGEVAPQPELCYDELDNDCDGEVDTNCAIIQEEPECYTNEDCDIGYDCVAGECVEPEPECTSDIDCPAGKICQAGGCIIQPTETIDGIPSECFPFNWDCSMASWGECSSTIRKQTRSLSSCQFDGPEFDNVGNSCAELTKNTVETERSCTPKVIVDDSCNSDDDCFAGEICDEFGDCVPEPVEDDKPFPWWIIIVVVLALVVIGGLAFFLVKMKGKGALGPKKGIGPFKKEADLHAVINYIKSAKMRKVPDATIMQALLKSGWTDPQIRYASQRMAQQFKKK